MRIRIDHAPDFQVRWTRENKGNKPVAQLLAGHHKVFHRFIDTMSKYEDDFRNISLDTQDPQAPHWNQIWFLPMDGMSSFSIVADKKPKMLLEIGSGNSTKFFALAKKLHSPDTQIISIDPEPRAEIDDICDVVYRERMETIDLKVFKQLKRGDVLFFDGSHRALQNSDVTVFFTEILPQLNPGVVVGLHDIFLPYDYPRQWINRYYNEQYMLATFLLASPNTNVLCACAYMYQNMKPELEDAFGEGFADMFPERVAQFDARINGLCFWFECQHLPSAP